MSYSRGGYVHGAALSGPSRSLAERIKSDEIQAIEIEYDRAYKSIESDPGSAVTAACAILESVCKCYLEEEGIALPKETGACNALAGSRKSPWPFAKGRYAR